MSKDTKSKIVNFARKLFSTVGVNNTTMSEVAKSSGLGRRTIYTHFRSRDELYDMVVALDIDAIFGKLKKISSQDIDPRSKMIMFVREHFNIIKELTAANRAIKYDFLKGDKRIEALRRTLDRDESHLIAEIINEGLRDRSFRSGNMYRRAKVILFSLKALERHCVLDRFGEESEKMIDQMIELLVDGLAQ